MGFRFSRGDQGIRLLHLGRPWLFYWLIPYPNTMTVWPNFRSPLVWDIFAVSTYFTISLLFWYQAVVPGHAHQFARCSPAWRRTPFPVTRAVLERGRERYNILIPAFSVAITASVIDVGCSE